MLLEGDGEGARIAMRTLEEFAALASAKPPSVTEIGAVRARHRRSGSAK
jgi:hypothetical protein